MNTTVIGIDLAKRQHQLHGVDKSGKAFLKKRVDRDDLVIELAKLAPALIGMEACGGSHYWARQVQALGHDVRLIAPQRVKPYIQGNKTDRRDAEGICEAVSRPNMVFVPIKTAEQQIVQSLHSERQRFVEDRTRLVNQLRGILAELGEVAPQGVSKARHMLVDILSEEGRRFGPIHHRQMERMARAWEQLDCFIAEIEQELEKFATGNQTCCMARSVQGVGLLTATAIVAVGDMNRFASGRQFASWIGLTPREHQSGDRRVMGGITKRGNVYLRSLLIHGARAMIWRMRNRSDGLARWIMALAKRRGIHVAICALANKHARMLWAMLTRNQLCRLPA